MLREVGYRLGAHRSNLANRMAPVANTHREYRNDRTNSACFAVLFLRGSVDIKDGNISTAP
jgi:hypothetical protein